MIDELKGGGSEGGLRGTGAGQVSALDCAMCFWYE